MRATQHLPVTGMAIVAVLGSSALLLLQGCAPRKVTVSTSPDLAKYRIERVAVLPFETRKMSQLVRESPLPFLVPEGASRSDIYLVEPPMRGGDEAAGPPTPAPLASIPAEAADRVTSMVYEKLKDRTTLNLISAEEARRRIGPVLQEWQQMRDEELVRNVATKLSVDAVLVGRLLVYQERGAGETPVGGGGSRWGGETAAVGFEVRLLAPDGTMLWEGNYYEKQRPMTQDLLGVFERGPLFLTAEQLANYGATKLVKKFPLQH